MVAAFGISLAFLSSVAKTGKTLAIKSSVTQTNEWVTAWAARTAALAVFIPLFVVMGVDRVPDSWTFWLSLGTNVTLITATSIVFAKAFKLSDVSLVSPLMSIIPLMTVFPAWVVLGEAPTVEAGIGIVLVTVGAYTLQLKTVSVNEAFEPFRRLYSDPGVRYVILGLLLSAPIPTVDKIGLTESSPVVWVTYLFTGLSLFLGVLAWVRASDVGEQTRSNWKVFAVAGLCNAGVWILQLYAYEFIYVSYVQAIKRVSILFSIVGGAYLFDEEDTTIRLLGGAIILLGVAFIIIGA